MEGRAKLCAGRKEYSAGEKKNRTEQNFRESTTQGGGEEVFWKVIPLCNEER